MDINNDSIAYSEKGKETDHLIMTSNEKHMNCKLISSEK